MPSLGEVNGRYTPGTSASRAPRAAPAQSGPGHRPTAATPPRREARNELKPAAAFRIPASRTQARTPGLPGQ